MVLSTLVGMVISITGRVAGIPEERREEREGMEGGGGFREGEDSVSKRRGRKQ
jgi:hypothetical protein